MNLALIGTGRMGRAVETAAAARGHAVVARFDAARPFLDSAPADLADAEVAVDFSAADVAEAHARRCAERGLPLVLGTTGWASPEALARVREVAEAGGTGVVWAPNFSLGLALVERALAGLLPLLDRLDEYDVHVVDLHHAAKLDSPSGTALRLAEQLVGGLARKSRVEAETVHGRIDPAALHVASSRAGHAVGTHTVGLDSAADRIEITHVARDRAAFALGAVRAAEWLPGRTGLFGLDDVLGDYAVGGERPAGSGGEAGV